MDSFDQVFQEVKHHCEVELSPTAYNLWIEPIQFVDFKQDTITLWVKTDIQRSIVENKYLDMISKSFKEVLGFDVHVEIQDREQPAAAETEQKQETRDFSDTKFPGEYEYTFDTFIVGNSNTFAYAACKAVANNQTGSYNPLFIYGPSGLGKTHLLVSIAHEIRKNHPDYEVVLITGEMFTNELINAIGKGTTNEFHEKYRNVDILLMDDVQFISGKIQTQEEFFHTFNELHNLGKQIVLTSDRPPKDIKALEDRLKTRFEWGLLADISPPDFETRVAIIRRKAELFGLDLPEDVTEYIANNLKNNIRQLEGAVKRLNALKELNGSTPSILMVQNAIQGILSNDQPAPITVELIIKEVARTFSVSEENIRSSKQSAQISRARQIAMYIVREITQMPLSDIGKEFNGRDHSTVVYAVQKVENMMKKDSHQKEIIEDIIKNIRDQ